MTYDAYYFLNRVGYLKILNILDSKRTKNVKLWQVKIAKDESSEILPKNMENKFPK